MTKFTGLKTRLKISVLEPSPGSEIKAWKFGCRARRAREGVVILRRPSSNTALRQNPKPFLVAEGIGEIERRLDHSDFHGLGRQHLDHVETEGDVGHLEQAEPMESSPPDELLFLPIDGIERTAHLLAATGLHLGKDEGVLVTADEIDLTSSGRAEIPAENFPAETLEMTGRGLLTPCSKGKMRPGVRTRRWAGRPAQNRGDDAGKVHARGA